MRPGWLIAVVVVMAGCVQSASVVCGDGVCPEGTTCDVALGRCLTPAELDACDGLAEGAVCTVAGARGECRAGACEQAVCGDGRATGAEACDGDELAGASCASLGFSGETSGLRCNELCRFETTGCTGICGDGVRDGSEMCDGANPDGVTCQDRGFYDPGPGPLTCNGLCGWDTSGCTGSCGDGIVNGPELCDGAPPGASCFVYGFDAGRAGCSAVCAAAFDRCARFGFDPRPTGTPTVSAFDASSVDDQWVVGVGGFSARLRPDQTWQPIVTGTLVDLTVVSAVSPVRAWAAGAPLQLGGSAVVLRWDGIAWTSIPGGPGVPPTDIVGLADAVVIGTLDGVHAWDAQGWRALGSLPGGIRAIDATNLDDVWAATLTDLYHWDGTGWTQALPDVLALDVVGVDDVVAMTRVGGSDPVQMQRWDGLTWTSSPTPMSTVSLVARAAGNSIWASNSDEVWHFDGIRWMPMDSAVPNAAPLRGLAAFGADTMVAAVGTGQAVRFQGQARMDLASVSFGTVKATWSDGAGNGVAVTVNGGVLYMRNFAWKGPAQPVSPVNLRAAWGSSSTDLWVGGTDGTIYHSDGTGWTAALTGLGSIARITGTSPTDVWTFGVDGAHHYDGATWTTYPPPGSLGFTGGAIVDGVVWALTDDGIYRLVGTSWVVAHLVTKPSSIAALAADNIYVTHDQDLTLLHYDGVSWTEVIVPVSRGLIQVAASAPDDVVAASSTELVHFDGTAWTPVRLDTSLAKPLSELRVFAHMIELVFATPSALHAGGIVRTRPWSCRATETACPDGVDDDCDGVLDALDSDCP